MKFRLSKPGRIFAIGMLLLLPGRASVDAVLSIAAPATIAQGSAFAVDVNIAGVSDLYDFEISLTFDPAVLSATSVTEGDFLPGAGITFPLLGVIDNVGGTVTDVADTLLGAIPGATGSGTVLEFEFLALAAGASPLDLGDVIVQDSAGNLVPVSVSNGSVTVSGPVVSTPEPGTLLLLCFAFCALSTCNAFWRETRPAVDAR